MQSGKLKKKLSDKSLEKIYLHIHFYASKAKHILSFCIASEMLKPWLQYTLRFGFCMQKNMNFEK